MVKKQEENKNEYAKLTDDQLAEERVKLDEQIQALRAKKKLIQDVVDSRYVEPDLTKGHTVGVGGKNG